jgi:hypothetical protein
LYLCHGGSIAASAVRLDASSQAAKAELTSQAIQSAPPVPTFHSILACQAQIHVAMDLFDQSGTRVRAFQKLLTLDNVNETTLLDFEDPLVAAMVKDGLPVRTLGIGHVVNCGA